MSSGMICGLVIGSMIILIVMITKFKVNAFIALLLCALGLALATGKGGAGSVDLVTSGFGATMEDAGIIIVLGVIIGHMLEKTGGAEKIAASILKLVGQKRAVLATCISGGIVSIPVFDDSGFLILYPAIKSLSKRGKIPLFSLVTALAICLLTTHCLVPPTPGPIAAAAILGADLGKVIMYGLFVSLFAITAVYFYANSSFVRNRFPRCAEDDEAEQTQDDSEIYKEGVTDRRGYSTFAAYMPIVVPILLIVGNSVLGQMLPKEHWVNEVFGFIGKPVIALLMGIGVIWVMTREYRTTVRMSWIEKAMDTTALVLLITAAGGAYGSVIRATGIGASISSILAHTSIPSICFPFLIALLVGTATGSATVSLTTTSAIVSPMLSSLGLSPELAVIATASGAAGIVNVNASMFWLLQRVCKFDMKTTAYCMSVGSVIMSAAAFLGTFILSNFIS